MANGVSCYRNGLEYSHGGLSLQECLTLELMVLPGKSMGSATSIKFGDVLWKGLRCSVTVEGSFKGLSLDIRHQPGNSATSIVDTVKPFKKQGVASVLIADDDLEGSGATIVVIDQNNELVAQIGTIIGGDDHD